MGTLETGDRTRRAPVRGVSTAAAWAWPGGGCLGALAGGCAGWRGSVQWPSTQIDMQAGRVPHA